MTDRTPWWYSGGEDRPGEPAEPIDPVDPAGEATADGPADGEPAGMDWTALLAGAARMVDWATSAVMAPHAEHDDPEQYPDCVVCRTLVLVGEPAPPPSPAPEPAEPITWIPFRD